LASPPKTPSVSDFPCDGCTSMNSEHVVEMKGICKRFGGVDALRSVDLELRRGEIMGSSATTRGQVHADEDPLGAYLADEGEIIIDGQKAHIRNPQDASNLGIAMIYQTWPCSTTWTLPGISLSAGNALATVQVAAG